MQIARPGFYSRDIAVAHEFLDRARNTLDGMANPAHEFSDTRALFQARGQYQAEMVYILDGIIPLGAPLLPQQAVFLDYIPWLRHIKATEDAQECQNAAAATAAVQAGRKMRATKNSLRWERSLRLDLSQRECLSRNGLRLE